MAARQPASVPCSCPETPVGVEQLRPRGPRVSVIGGQKGGVAVSNYLRQYGRERRSCLGWYRPVHRPGSQGHPQEV